MKPDRIVMIGAGVVARALIITVEKVGVRIDRIGVRNKDTASKALKPFRLHNKITSIVEAAHDADIILIAVSDDAIQSVAHSLYQHQAIKENAVLIHFNGAQSSAILRNPSVNTQVASAHPLQTFPNVDAALNQLKNAYWFCEGDAKALKWIQSVIEKIGNRYVEIKTENKVLYHIGAVFACNYLTTLLATAQKCQQKAGIEQEQSLTALRPLIEATLENIFMLGTTQALTGPIARGDTNTVKNHLNSLQGLDQQMLGLYKSLGLATLEISREKGVASAEKLSDLEQLLQKF